MHTTMFRDLGTRTQYVRSTLESLNARYLHDPLTSARQGQDTTTDIRATLHKQVRGNGDLSQPTLCSDGNNQIYIGCDQICLLITASPRMVSDVVNVGRMEAPITPFDLRVENYTPNIYRDLV